MKIELLEYAIENEGTTQVWANLSISVDDIGPIRWHLMPKEWDRAGEWVTFQSGIGAPMDEFDLSCLSAEDRSLLLGERHGIEEIQNLDGQIESALREQMSSIKSEIKPILFAALDQQYRDPIYD